MSVHSAGDTRKRCRLIAFYLPQFHPIPENDAWWGKGFTEWTNVAQARPLFRGHHQPHVPADLGFYDLRVPETRLAQAEMAREYGIEGFCYWHYWFAGKRLLERPFNEVLKSSEPDLPFCLAWANQSWTGIWHGAPNRILVEQTYPGLQDYKAHFYALLEAFGDQRYITVAQKPVFAVYNPRGLPNPRQFTDCWRELALQQGLKGLYFIGVGGWSWDPGTHGFDAAVHSNPAMALARLDKLGRIDRACQRLINRDLGFKQLYKKITAKPDIYSYRKAIKHMLPPLAKDLYPCVIPNWDNTPRSGVNGFVFHNSTPTLFATHLEQAIEQVCHREADKQMVFVKSWNEWAEGNYLEPDQRFGRAFLQALSDTVFEN